MTRRAALWALGLAAVAAAFVAYGRHERSHAIRIEQQRLLAIRHTVGDRISRPGETLYNAPLQFTCAYYGLNELCFDPQHRLVEAVDANGAIATVRWDHSASPWVMPEADWRRAFPKQPPESYYP